MRLSRAIPADDDIFFHSLYHVRERLLHSPEKDQPSDQQKSDYGKTYPDSHNIWMTLPKNGPAKAFNDANHGDDGVKASPFRRNDADRINDRRGIHPDLEHKR